jgi:signal transduction histidine kinase
VLQRDPLPEAEPGRRGLQLGILVYRWASFVLTLVLAAVTDLTEPAIAWLALAVLAGWLAAVTWLRAWERRAVRWIDLAISVGFLAVAALVTEPRSLHEQPFLAAAYAISTVLTWAATAGLWPAVAVAVGLSIPLTLSRPLNDLPFSELSGGEVAGLAAQALYYVFAAVTIGLFARTIERAATDLRTANESAVRERELAARAREREALARELHDSVLQSLALVQRRGRELAAREQLPGSDVAELVQVAGEEERALRALLQRQPEDVPEGTLPLRTVLQAAAYGVSGVEVGVSTVEPVWLRAADAQEVSAAIRQALENVAEHARASSATVFGELDGDAVAITVRDDGVGFDVDEERLSADGRLGITRSMRGRVEQLGGTMRIKSAPGRGTEVEFRIPAPDGGAP